MARYRLIVSAEHHKNTDSRREWDGTWDGSYAYTIYDENNVDVDTIGGFPTADIARRCGEKRLDLWQR